MLTTKNENLTAEDLREVTGEAVAGAGRADRYLSSLLGFARERAREGESEVYFLDAREAKGADFWELETGERKAVLAALADRGFDVTVDPESGPLLFEW